jgi:hypothetical protein
MICLLFRIPPPEIVGGNSSNVRFQTKHKLTNNNSYRETETKEQKEDWATVFNRLDSLPKSTWESTATVTRDYPYHNDGTLTIYASQSTNILRKSELEFLRLNDTPYTVLILRFENDTAHEIPIFLSQASCCILISSNRQSYTAIDPSDTISNRNEYPSFPFNALDNCPRFCLQELHAGARAYMTLVFPKVDSIKQLNISTTSPVCYEAILRF